MTYRPKSLEELIGCDDIKQAIRVAVSGARVRNDAFPHTLLYAGPGLGKTTIASIIANEMGSDFKSYLSNVFEETKDVQNLMAGLNSENYDAKGKTIGPIKPTIIFLDEIHQLSKKVQEAFFQAMEDNIFTVERAGAYNGAAIKTTHWVPRFTLIGATTKPGMLDKAFIERFKLVFTLNTYSEEELGLMGKKYVESQALDITPKAIKLVAVRSRGVARKMINFIERSRDTALSEGKQKIDETIVEKTFKMLGIDKMGLEKIDLRVLTYLYRIYPQRIGVSRLAGALGVNDNVVKDIIEPYLIRQNLIEATPSGRMITADGVEYCETNGLIITSDDRATGTLRKVPNV